MPPPDCSAFPPSPAGNISWGSSGVNHFGDIVVTDAPPPGSDGRQGQRAEGSAVDRSADYAYILACDEASEGSCPLQRRISRRQRDGSFPSYQCGTTWSCFDDPNVATPAPGFDTQTGSGPAL